MLLRKSLSNFWLSSELPQKTLKTTQEKQYDLYETAHHMNQEKKKITKQTFTTQKNQQQTLGI